MVGEEKLSSWPEINQKVDDLNGVSQDYSPSDYQKLYSLVVTKKVIQLDVCDDLHAKLP